MSNYPQNGKDFGGRVLDGMAEELGGGFNLGIASNAVNKSIRALEKQAAALESADYTPGTRKCKKCGEPYPHLDSKLIGQTMAYTAKMINEITRVSELVQGNPDSRPDITGLGDLLQLLTDEQLDQFGKWLAENKAKRETKTVATFNE